MVSLNKRGLTPLATSFVGLAGAAKTFATGSNLAVTAVRIITLRALTAAPIIAAMGAAAYAAGPQLLGLGLAATSALGGTVVGFGLAAAAAVRYENTVEKAGTAAFRLNKRLAQFRRIMAPTSDILINGVARALTIIEPALEAMQPSLRIFARSMSRGMGALAEGFFELQPLLDDFVRRFAPLIPKLTPVVLKLAEAFVHLATAGLPVLRELIGYLDTGAGYLRDWATDLRAIWSIEDIDISQKFDLSVASFRERFRPVWEGVVSWWETTGKERFFTAWGQIMVGMAEVAGRNAPKVAEAFARGLLQAGPPGWALAGLLGAKWLMALFGGRTGIGNAGRTAGGSFARGFIGRASFLIRAAARVGGPLAMVATAAWWLAKNANKNLPTGAPARRREAAASPGSNFVQDPFKARATPVHPYRGPRQHGGQINLPGTYTVGERGPERVTLPGGAHVEANRPIVVHTHVHLDGKEVARSVFRQGVLAKATR